MSLSDIAAIIEIVGIITIIGGLYFGLNQLRQNRLQGLDMALSECARSFENKEFTEPYRLISSLSQSVNKQQLEAMDAKYHSAATRVCMKFETIGLLIHREIVPIDAMEDLVGGATILIWDILEPWIMETRKENNHELFVEWFQWLVERLRELGTEQRAPANIRYANWKGPNK